MWFVYIVQCADKTLYTGITLNLDRRLEEHNSVDSGAKYTRGRQPVKLVYDAAFKDRAAAAKEEARIKKLYKSQKIKLIKERKRS
jgi:putative endonuclease